MSTEVRWTEEMEAEVRRAALEAGFHLFGVAEADAGEAEGGRFAAWVEAGRAGEMEYLKRRDEQGVLLREGVRVAIPWARSVVVCALNYASGEVYSIEETPKDAGWIGRYAWSGKKQGTGHRDQGSEVQREGRSEKGEGEDGTGIREQGAEDLAGIVATDYHLEMMDRLRVVEAAIRSHMECETRCYVDTGPIVERGLAARAGVGWVGKNTCVINQNMGSWMLLGVVITSLEMPGDALAGWLPAVAADRCGSCTRCIEACPTDALVAPREMDASRCIAYLTIEKKGAIPEELRTGMGRQVFGCDICQDVCPWNRRAKGTVTPGMEVRQELVNPPLAWLGSLDNREFRRWFKGSPLERTGRKRLQRNVAIAMGNSGDASFEPKLREWADGEDAVLAEAAGWAIRQGIEKRE